jgi:hypothetical protein
VQLIESAKNESSRRKAAYSLGKICTGNPETIAALVQLIESTENESTRWQAADSLGKIDPGNQTAISTLVQLIESTEDESTRWQAAESLKKSLRGDQLVGIVTGLKDYLPDEAQENDFERFHQCYKVIWYCAQNMPYVNFYQTWHSQPTHIEVVETTDVGSNPFTRSLNLAELPQSIEAAIANDLTLSQTIHLICIDGSKFIDRDNPATKIYTEMVRSGCPKCEDGTPKTMQELQAYWDLLDTDKRVVLVFYEGTGFSETFQNALSKFDGALCVITAQTIDNLPLQCFSPNQAIADIVEWIKKVALEV